MKCLYCEGEGKVRVFTHHYKCFACNGSGEFSPPNKLDILLDVFRKGGTLKVRAPKDKRSKYVHSYLRTGKFNSSLITGDPYVQELKQIAEDLKNGR